MFQPNQDLYVAIAKGFTLDGGYVFRPAPFVDSGMRDATSDHGRGFLVLKQGSTSIATFYAVATAPHDIDDAWAQLASLAAEAMVGARTGSASASRPYNPLVIVPYLDNAHLQQAEQLNVSLLDLCGNAAISSKTDSVFIWISGKPNRYTAAIDAFSGQYSLVSRLFAVRTRVTNLQGIAQAIRQRGAEISPSTVSKAVSSLVGAGILGRDERTVWLRDPETLLDKLIQRYDAPALDWIGAINGTVPEIAALLNDPAVPPLVLLGRDSNPFYQSAPLPPMVGAFVPQPDVAIPHLQARLGARFMRLGFNPPHSIQLFTTARVRKFEPIQFDSRPLGVHYDTAWSAGPGNSEHWGDLPNGWLHGLRLASPIQTILDLQAEGTARSREHAAALRKEWLQRVKVELEIDRRLDKAFRTSKREHHARSLHELIESTQLTEHEIRARLRYRDIEFRSPLPDLFIPTNPQRFDAEF